MTATFNVMRKNACSKRYRRFDCILQSGKTAAVVRLASNTILPRLRVPRHATMACCAVPAHANILAVLLVSDNAHVRSSTVETVAVFVIDLLYTRRLQQHAVQKNRTPLLWRSDGVAFVTRPPAQLQRADASYVASRQARDTASLATKLDAPRGAVVEDSTRQVAQPKRHHALALSELPSMATTPADVVNAIRTPRKRARGKFSGHRRLCSGDEPCGCSGYHQSPALSYARTL